MVLSALKTRVRALLAPFSRFINRLPFIRRWLILGTLIGCIAGFGAVVFYTALTEATHYLLTDLGGFRPPTPAGEGGLLGSAGFSRPWAIPLVVGGGALVAGLLVFRFAPEAEGHGTDAAISAVHNNPRGIRLRAVVVKIVASAITIGSGGSGGREGPTGQISAGFGSLLARALDLSPADARIAVSSGIGSGIGAIFGAPLGGAVLSAEILYRDDFEPSALVPSFVASTVSYAIFASIEGFEPLFGLARYSFHDPVKLAWFALIGVIGGLVGLLYAKGFYGIAGLFNRLPIYRGLRPAIGGLLVGLVALAVPEVLGTGYGWIQQGLGPGLLRMPLWIVVVLPFARILATGLSIGSGGSGGIFGPGMVIGAFVGAAFWRLLEGSVPNVGHDPVPYVIVGMMACFGSIARAPLAVMLMVAEMTGSLEILAPAMAAVGIATLIVSRSDDTIYRSQPKNRAETGAGRIVVEMPLLNRLLVSQAVTPSPIVFPATLGAGEALHQLHEANLVGAPVLDGGGRLIGAVELSALQEAPAEAPVESLADTTVPSVRPELTLADALEALGTTTSGWVPVLDTERHVLGVLRLADLTHAYRRALSDAQRSLEGDEAGAGRAIPRTRTVQVGSGSPLDGRRLGEAAIPAGLVVTSLRRGEKTLVPSSDTRLAAGDELSVVGNRRPAEELEALAAGRVDDAAALAGHCDGSQSV